MSDRIEQGKNSQDGALSAKAWRDPEFFAQLPASMQKNVETHPAGIPPLQLTADSDTTFELAKGTSHNGYASKGPWVKLCVDTAVKDYHQDAKHKWSLAEVRKMATDYCSAEFDREATEQIRKRESSGKHGGGSGEGKHEGSKHEGSKHGGGKHGGGEDNREWRNDTFGNCHRTDTFGNCVRTDTFGDCVRTDTFGNCKNIYTINDGNCRKD